MGQIRHPGGHYSAPLDSSGNTPVQEPSGIYLLASGTTYYFPIGGKDALVQSAHLVAHDATLVITSATVQTCNRPEAHVSDYDTAAGNWIPETPSTAYVGVTGSGWSQSNGVVASTGSALGGAMWHLGETGAARHRIAVVVGGTGGHASISVSGKT